jgi:hypothetical protein
MTKVGAIVDRVGASVFLRRADSSLREGSAFAQRSVWVPATRWTLEHGDRVFPLIAAALIVISIAFPYWRLKLNAPQYPNGLTVSLGLNSIGGDAAEIDGLNHYIGMRPLAEGGAFERSIAVYSVSAMAGLAALAMIRRRWMWLAAIPALLFPAVFTADLFYWLYTFGHNLDPTAALSNAFDDFTPTLLGPGRVGQFTTWSFYEAGFGMAFLASVLLVLAVVSRLHRERGQA